MEGLNQQQEAVRKRLEEIRAETLRKMAEERSRRESDPKVEGIKQAIKKLMEEKRKQLREKELLEELKRKKLEELKRQQGEKRSPKKAPPKPAQAFGQHNAYARPFSQNQKPTPPRPVVHMASVPRPLGQNTSRSSSQSISRASGSRSSR